MTLGFAVIGQRQVLRCSLLLYAILIAACSTAPNYKTQTWRDCYLEYEQAFLQYADKARNCGYVNRLSSAANLQKAQACVSHSLRVQARFLLAKQLNGTDEWACEVIIGDEQRRTFQLIFSSDLYTKPGRFEAFQCREVRIDGNYLSGVSAENCQEIEASTMKQ